MQSFETLTTALVLETNNLRGGGAGTERAVASLERLLAHLRTQSRSLARLDGIVVTHDGIPLPEQERLTEVAGVAVRFVELAPGAGYYEAKNLGFDATTAAVVVFADADCWPDPLWLERLLAPFEEDSTQVVAGRTTYRPDLLGTAATTLDFLYYKSPLAPGCVRNFYANNVAFRREVFAEHRYKPLPSVYRGHCQVLGLALQRAGVPVRFAGDARTYHRFPDSLAELGKLRLLRGSDTAELTPALVAAYAGKRWRWLGRLGPVSSVAVLTGRLGVSLRAIGRQGMPELSPLRTLACAATLTGLSALDMVGSVVRSFGVKVAPGEDASASALSYHGAGDGLEAVMRAPATRAPATRTPDLVTAGG